MWKEEVKTKEKKQRNRFPFGKYFEQEIGSHGMSNYVLVDPSYGQHISQVFLCIYDGNARIHGMDTLSLNNGLLLCMLKRGRVESSKIPIA